MSTGTRIAQARKKQNLTQEQLAEQLGVTRQSVSRWESDAAYPETDKLVRLAQLFGVSCDYLLQGAGRRVQLTFYEDGLNVACDWCTILEFDGVWANVEFARKRRDWRETQLVPLASIRSITFLKDEGKGGEA